jgi:hypothetical protein
VRGRSGVRSEEQVGVAARRGSLRGFISPAAAGACARRRFHLASPVGDASIRQRVSAPAHGSFDRVYAFASP